jgi:hypothetical protein
MPAGGGRSVDVAGSSFSAARRSSCVLTPTLVRKARRAVRKDEDDSEKVKGRLVERAAAAKGVRRREEPDFIAASETGAGDKNAIPFFCGFALPGSSTMIKNGKEKRERQGGRATNSWLEHEAERCSMPLTSPKHAEGGGDTNPLRDSSVASAKPKSFSIPLPFFWRGRGNVVSSWY